MALTRTFRFEPMGTSTCRGDDLGARNRASAGP